MNLAGRIGKASARVEKALEPHMVNMSRRKKGAIFGVGATVVGGAAWSTARCGPKTKTSSSRGGVAYLNCPEY